MMEVITKTHRCYECRKQKQEEDFSPYAWSSPYPSHTICKKCKSIRMEYYYQENKERISKRNRTWNGENKEAMARNTRAWLLKNYRLTFQAYEKLLEKQKYCCASCGDALPIDRKEQHIDHDHVTDRVRGILCRGCNCGIGNFKDDIERLKKAIDYLERSKSDGAL